MRLRMRGILPAAIVPVAAALVFVVAGCGAAGGNAGSGASPGASAAASPPASAASGAPAPDIVQAAPVQHVKVGDLDVGYRTIGPLGGSGATGGGALPGASTGASVQPLLLIMGSSGTMDLWAPQLVSALAQDRQVVVFDNRGIGETDDPGGAYPFSQLADDTAGLIEALGYGKMDVLGWSMGADVAIDMAVRHPEVVSRLVSYAGDPGGSHAVPPTKAAMAALMNTSGTPQQRGERLIEVLFPEAYRKANPAYAASFPIPTEQASAAAVGLQDRAIGEWKGVWAGLTSISCPALFVTGTDDIISPPQNAAMMAGQVPASWLVRFPGAGHGLMYQNPTGLANVVLTFLDTTQ